MSVKRFFVLFLLTGMFGLIARAQSRSDEQDPVQREINGIIRERLQSPPDALKYYDRAGEGIRLYAAGKVKEAEAVLEEVTREYPLDGYTWLHLGLTRQSLRKPREAVEAYLRARELHTKVAGWLVDLLLSQCYLALGDRESMYRSLEELIYKDRFASRQWLYDSKTFAPLRAEARFQKLTAHVDASKMSRTEGWRNDIEMVIEEIKRVNPIYSKEPLPPAVIERYRKLLGEIPKLTDDEIYAGLAYMIAPLNQGHTLVGLTPDSRPPVRTLPLSFYAFPEGIFVTAADEGNRDLVGAELRMIEGVPVGEVLRRIEEHQSVENRMKIFTVGIGDLRTLPMLRGLGIVKRDEERVRLTLRLKNGEVVQRSVMTEPGDVERPMTPGQKFRKFGPPPGVPPQLFLRNVERAHWFERLPEADAFFVQVNQMQDGPDETLKDFGLKLRQALNETAVKNVIVDLRHNNGGTTALYNELLRTLVGHTTKEGNRLYVIVGRGVYSACANFVTDLERLARPVFVGEPTSGTGNQDGDPSYLMLPYSRISVMTTSVEWQLSTPWDLRRSLVPDIPVELTARAYFEGRDPALDAVLQDIRRPARPEVPEFR